MQFPPVCPEVPVSDLAEAMAWYRDRLGFTIDWGDPGLGLAGLSRDGTRLFLSSGDYRATLGNRPPVVLWINLEDRGAIDALHAEWAAAGARIRAAPAARPYKLYEFLAEDPDGNVFRVFYDFAWETP